MPDNTEFCTIPLTFKLRINPFRYRADLDPEPEFLVHAVMALAGHHVKSDSMLAHRQAALQLLRQSVCSLKDVEVMYSVLDTIVVLFSLDVGLKSIPAEESDAAKLMLTRKPNPCLAIGTYTSWELIPFSKPVAVSRQYRFPPD